MSNEYTTEFLNSARAIKNRISSNIVLQIDTVVMLTLIELLSIFTLSLLMDSEFLPH